MMVHRLQDFIEYFVASMTTSEISVDQYIQRHSDLFQLKYRDEFQRIVNSMLKQFDMLDQTGEKKYSLLSTKSETKKEATFNETHKQDSINTNLDQEFKRLLQLLYHCQQSSKDFSDFYFDILDQCIKNENEKVVHMALQEIALHISQSGNDSDERKHFIQCFSSYVSTSAVSTLHQPTLNLIKTLLSTDKIKETMISIISLTNIDVLYPYRAHFLDVRREFRDSTEYFIDGDSLLLSIAHHTNVDLKSYYGNTLHIIYIIERILHTLFNQARQNNYTLLFFDCHYQLYQQSNSILALIRACLIVHLTRNANKYGIAKISQFSSWLSDEYLKFASEEKPMFIFYHDMSSFDINNDKLLPKVVLEKLLNVYRLFGNYHQYVIQCHLYLMNKLILTEISVQCFQIRFNEEYPLDKMKKIDELLYNRLNTITNKEQREDILVKFSLEIGQVDVRLFLYLKSMTNLMEEKKEENLLKSLCPLLVLHVSLLIRLSLVDRHLSPSFTSVIFSPTFSQLLIEFQQQLALNLSSSCSSLSWSKVADLFDGRLFAFTIYQIHQSTSNLRFDSETYEIIKPCLKILQVPSNETLFQGAVEQMTLSNDIMFSAPVTARQSIMTEPTEIHQKMTKISNRFIDAYLKPRFSMKGKITFELVEPNDIQVTRYEGKHHWHVYKEVGDEISRIRDNNREQFNVNPRFSETIRQNAASYFTLYGNSLTTRDIRDTQLDIYLPPLPTESSAKEEDFTNKRPSATASKGRNTGKHKNPAKKNFPTKVEIMRKVEKDKMAKLEVKEAEMISNVNAQLKLYEADNYSAIIAHINIALPEFQVASKRLDLLQLKFNAERKYFRILKNKIHLSQQEKSKLEFLRVDFFATMAEMFPLQGVMDVFTEKLEFLDELLDDQPFDKEKWYRFQLTKINSRLPRRQYGVKDERLPDLIPDQWQLQFFDAIDQQHSIIIVAPTASGKTYASYYAMKSVIDDRYGKNGICVYVAPTKALVNQVAATIQSKLGAVFGIFTRDFRQNVEECRILVTVPQCLEILLLSPHHQWWCQRIQYCIFDEIHCMSGETGSDVWERTMLLINCPMIGLSATVNNGHSLRNWIDSAEKERHRLFKTSKPREVCFISYGERLADLNKYLYSNRQLHPLHPIGLMDSKQITTRGLPKDFSLSPNETLQLKDALEKNGVNTETIPSLTEYFSPDWIIERNLSNEYSHLVREQFDHLLNSKQNSTIDAIAQSLNPLKSNEISYPEEKSIPSLIVEFMLTLQEKNLLPCIVFSDSRHLCERMANSVANYFIQLEEKLRATKYKQRIEEIKHRSLQIEISKQKAKNKKSVKPSKRRNNEDNPTERQMFDDDLNTQTQLPGHEQQLLDGMLDECTLANQRGCNQERVNTFLTKASKNNPRLVTYMKRGVAFHHANVNNKGRVAVEALFRDRYVQLIFSTSTLALGIHMPTKTVAFVKDSIYLDALQYRQTSGRAGRRGFDVQGHIVFIDIPVPKIRHLMISAIPDIHPHFPTTVTFLMRLLHLCFTAKKEDQQDTINRSLVALQCSFMGQSPDKRKRDLIDIQLHFHCLHTLDFLHRLNLIDGKGALVGLAGLSTHLHYKEPANILLVYLINAGLFHQINDHIEIVAILARLFTALPWLITHNQYKDLSSTMREERFNSKLFLPPISTDLKKSIDSYNSVVKTIYGFYIENVIRQMRSLHDNQVELLPFSNVSFHFSSDYNNGTFEYNLHHVYSQQLNNISISPFAGLSGLTHHQFMSNYNSTVASWDLAYPLDLSSRVVPFLDIDARDHTNSAYYLNSYALDFFKHGSERSLILENQLGTGDTYNLLFDFLLMLSSIKTSLEVILKNELQQTANNDVEFFQSLSDKMSCIRQIFSDKFYKQYPDRKAV